MSTVKDLPDVQAHADERGKHVQKAGINNYAIPFQVRVRDGGVQHTCGIVSMYTSLNEKTKGVNMSRYSQTIEKAVQHGVISIDFLEELLNTLKEKLGSEDSYVKIKFPYFIKKKAPVSENVSHFKVDCELEGRCDVDGKVRKYLTVTVVAASVCPCSKLMSSLKHALSYDEYNELQQLTSTNLELWQRLQQFGRGAHNQRSKVKLTLHLLDFIWVEELVELIEKCASVPIWNTLKRPDEKYVTEHGYSNPRFVEDTAREISLQMDALLLANRTDDWVAVITNEESLHQSDAIAVIKGGKCLIP